MHEQFPDQDRAVTDWFAGQGWPVSRRNYDFDHEILAWRSETIWSQMTLYISQEIVEDTPDPDDLVNLLSRFDVAALLRKHPKKYTWLRRDDATATPYLVQLDRPPSAHKNVS